MCLYDLPSEIGDPEMAGTVRRNTVQTNTAHFCFYWPPCLLFSQDWCLAGVGGADRFFSKSSQLVGLTYPCCGSVSRAGMLPKSIGPSSQLVN